MRSDPRARRRSGRRSRRPPPQRTTQPQAAAVSTRYRPDPARRKANLAHFVAQMRQTDPGSADQLAQDFAKGDFIGKIGAMVAPVGLRTDDVADAYALYWITAYDAMHGQNPTPSKRKVSAVRAQAARALATTPEFAGANDAARQEMAESLWVQTALLDGAVEQSKAKPEQLTAVGKAAAQGARGMGLDLSAMTLTEDGFVMAGES